jgi:hypothetical protein
MNTKPMSRTYIIVTSVALIPLIILAGYGIARLIDLAFWSLGQFFG